VAQDKDAIMDEVRVGIIGVGGMGSFHASQFVEGNIK
jgi:tRNA A37 threonylcarbamoyladenosine dehydratase